MRRRWLITRSIMRVAVIALDEVHPVTAIGAKEKVREQVRSAGNFAERSAIQQVLRRLESFAGYEGHVRVDDDDVLLFGRALVVPSRI